MKKLFVVAIATATLGLGAQSASAYTEYLRNGCGYYGCGYHRVYGQWHRHVWNAPNRGYIDRCGYRRCY